MGWKQSKGFKSISLRGKAGVGYALHLAQCGEKYQEAKPLKGCGNGVYEVVSNHDTNTYRAVYIVNLGDSVYVLHAFQKKSKRGIKTPKEEIDKINNRLKQLKQALKQGG